MNRSPRLRAARGQGAAARGGRGKSGLCLANEPEVVAVAATIAERMQAMGVPPHILIEEKIAIEAECYLAWRIDDVRQAPVMLFSTRGGVEIEAHAGGLHEFVWDPLRSLHPHHLVRFLLEAGASRRGLGALARFATELYRLLVAEDAELAEINPLAVTENGQVTALDAKLVLDDNARFRHRDWDELCPRSWSVPP